MELRAQLAAHEGELAELKRKWERIVHRGFDRAYGPNGLAHPPSSPSTITTTTTPGPKGGSTTHANTNTNMGGLQGVGRMLAGLADISSAPRSPSAVPSPSHAARPSTSSVSTAGTGTTAGTRLSRGSSSSLTSFEESVEGGKKEKDEEEGEEEEMGAWVVAPTAVTDAQARAAKLQRRKSRDRPAVEGARGLELGLPTPETETPSSSSMWSAAQPTPKSPPRVRRSATAPAPAPSPSPLPSPVSPGLASLGARALEQPVAHWVGSVGRRLERGNTNLKRASLLLSDVGQSFFAALASPGPTSGNGGTEKEREREKEREKEKEKKAAARSLLDEDEDGGGALGGDVLVPDTRGHVRAAAAAPAKQAKDEFDEWNW
jgi:hypothetical protein